MNREERRLVPREKKKVKDGTLRNRPYFVLLKRGKSPAKGREAKQRDEGITNVF